MKYSPLLHLRGGAISKPLCAVCAGCLGAPLQALLFASKILAGWGGQMCVHDTVCVSYMVGVDPSGLSWGLSTFPESCFLSHLYSYSFHDATRTAVSNRLAALRWSALTHPRGRRGHAEVYKRQHTALPDSNANVLIFHFKVHISI